MANWVRVKGWRVNDGPEHILLGNGKETAFKLVDITQQGINQYDVTYTNDEMDASWQETWFLQRGQQELPWGREPLPEWVDGLPEPQASTQKNLYTDTIAAWLHAATTNTVRLEGEIEVAVGNGNGTKLEEIRLFLAEGATLLRGRPSDLLVIVSRETFDFSRESGEPTQDGTAHARQR